MSEYDTWEPMKKENKLPMIIIILVFNVINVIIQYNATYHEISQFSYIFTVILSVIVFCYFWYKDNVEKDKKIIENKISQLEYDLKNSEELWNDNAMSKELRELKKEKEHIKNHFYYHMFKKFLDEILLIRVPICVMILITTIFQFVLLWKTRSQEIRTLPKISDKKTNEECYIKWNVEFEWTEKIYHLPWCSHYNETVINPDYWEKRFCTEKEAVDAGRRKCIDE